MNFNYIQALNKKYRVHLRKISLIELIKYLTEQNIYNLSFIKTKSKKIFLYLCNKLNKETNYYNKCEIKKCLLNNFLYEYDSNQLKIKQINNFYILCEKVDNNWFFSIKNNLNMDLKYVFNLFNNIKYKDIFKYIEKLYDLKVDIDNMTFLYSLEDENNLKETYYEQNGKTYILLENKNAKILNIE